MKREELAIMRRVGFAVLWSAVTIGLAACQGKSLTAPSETKSTPSHATGASVNGTYDPRHGDDDDDDDDDLVTVSLKANPTEIQRGQSSTLTWTSHEADDVYLDNELVDKEGSKIVFPTETRTYTIAAIGEHTPIRVTASATVTVSGTGSPPVVPTATLSASPTSIQSGQSSTLTWSTSNATTVTLDGASVAAYGTQTVSPAATATYSLVATNSSGSTTATATVTVTALPPMPTTTLNANPASIQTGQSSTLTWTTSNATEVTLNGAPVAAYGTQTVSPAATATYSLVATNSSGSRTATATVTVTAPPPMPTAMLNANPMSIQSGQSSTLSWATSNATAVTLDGASVAANGSRLVTPAATTTYTLQATNSSGSVTSTVTVTVTAMQRFTYVNDIAPIMQANCVQCHSGPNPAAGRDYTTYDGVRAVANPFDPNSLIIQATQPGGSMHLFLQPDPAVRAEIIRRWIVESGAPQQ